MSRIKIAIVGATGYTGREALALLLRHGSVEVSRLCAIDHLGEPVATVFPQFYGRVDSRIEPFEPEAIAHECDAAFLCVPHTASMTIAADLLNRGLRVVDFSADFRLADVETYNRTYRTTHTAPGLIPRAVYGLPELHRDDIRTTDLLANPGCYPTGAILAALPALKMGLADSNDVVVDAKSGVSGAGRTPNPRTVFSECNESVEAYSVGTHRHQPEIDQELSRAAGREVRVTFTPHLVPMTRGILSTVYLDPDRQVTVESAHRAYAKFYESEPFVEVLPLGTFPKTSSVAFTNGCHIGLTMTPSGKLVAISAIDNLIKGASGQAVQCLNLMFGFDETEGLVR